jgi:hypothetical protein
MPAISNIEVTPSRIAFTASWEGPAVGQRVHELRRNDLPPSTNTAQEIEDFINKVWLPQEFRDTQGQRTGFAACHVYTVTSPTEVDWAVIVSNNPIPDNWWG